MSVDSASHDDVAGLFKRLGKRAGAPQYHDFSDVPATTTSLPREIPREGLPPAAVTTAPPTMDVEAAPAPQQPILEATAETSLQRLFQRLAQVPLLDSAQSPLARLRQR